MLINGDSIQELKKLSENSVDLIVTDPPYGYSFMGKEWDKALPDKRIWKECLRVLKHGGFAYIMSSPRQDVLARMMIDLEDVGFNTAFTSMYWAYASGFPKATNIGKVIDKKLNVKPKVVGVASHAKNLKEALESKTGFLADSANKNNKKMMGYGDELITEVSSEQAKKMDGSYAGFQPKPAVEVIIVCMKPLYEKNYIEQAMKDGKGVTWLDDCRIPFNPETNDKRLGGKGSWDTSKCAENIYEGGYAGDRITSDKKGRFPANLLVSDNAVDTGEKTKSPNSYVRNADGFNQNDYGKGVGEPSGKFSKNFGDEGDFSRYFNIDKWYESQFIITPKASKSEKNKEVNNNHPTVKPLKLMSYLVTLGSREGDIVLDPFMGSGTTPLASKQLKRKYIGIEREPEYFKICCARVGDEPTKLELPESETKEEYEKTMDTTTEDIVDDKPRCDVCGATYEKDKKEEHEARQFHKNSL